MVWLNREEGANDGMRLILLAGPGSMELPLCIFGGNLRLRWTWALFSLLGIQVWGGWAWSLYWDQRLYSGETEALETIVLCLGFSCVLETMAYGV